MNWIDYTLIVVAAGLAIFAFATGIWPISILISIIEALTYILG